MAFISFIILILIARFSGQNINLLAVMYMTCLATVLEQIGPWGIDNITVPIGVTCTSIWLLGT